jgi:hypothetical protein
MRGRGHGPDEVWQLIRSVSKLGCYKRGRRSSRIATVNIMLLVLLTDLLQTIDLANDFGFCTDRSNEQAERTYQVDGSGLN